jgi:hypothetical protein
MFSYKLFVVLTTVPGILSISIAKVSSNEPERCCVPKQFSSKISLSTGIVLPDGKAYTSYVISSNNIL